MSDVQWQEILAEREFGLAQIRPYPVAAPHSLEALQGIVKSCTEYGYRVLPMGSGSSFPPNFALRSERTFAISVARLNTIQQTEDGLPFCPAGTPVRQVVVSHEDVQRVTIGGLLCGYGDAATRRLARAFWQFVKTVIILDSQARSISHPGPAAPNFILSQTSALLLDSRGKAGVLVGVVLDKHELPVEIPALGSLSDGQANGKTALARQPYIRALDPTSLFDW